MSPLFRAPGGPSPNSSGGARAPRHRVGPLKTLAKASKRPPRPPKMPPRRPKRRPTGSKKPPRRCNRLPERPKRPQEASKEGFRRPDSLMFISPFPCFWHSRFFGFPTLQGRSRGPETAPRLPKGPRTAQEPSKTAQEAAETGPRGAPERDDEPKNGAFRFRGLPGSSKRARVPKDSPRGAQNAPRGPQEAHMKELRGFITGPKKQPSLISICSLKFVWASRLFWLLTL